MLSFHKELFRNCLCKALSTSHAKGKTAAVKYERNLARFHPLVHSASTDRKWAIRFVTARVDFILFSLREAKLTAQLMLRENNFNDRGPYLVIPRKKAVPWGSGPTSE